MMHDRPELRLGLSLIQWAVIFAWPSVQDLRPNVAGGIEARRRWMLAFGQYPDGHYPNHGMHWVKATRFAYHFDKLLNESDAFEQDTWLDRMGAAISARNILYKNRWWQIV